MNKAEVYREAAAIVRKGWGQGHMHTIGMYDRHYYCALGAIGKACGNMTASNYGVFTEGLIQVLEIPFSEGDSFDWLIVSWNDAGERTQEEVVRAFERAAEVVEQEEAQGKVKAMIEEAEAAVVKMEKGEVCDAIS